VVIPSAVPPSTARFQSFSKQSSSAFTLGLIREVLSVHFLHQLHAKQNLLGKQYQDGVLNWHYAIGFRGAEIFELIHTSGVV